MQTIYYRKPNNPTVQILDQAQTGAWISTVSPTQIELDVLAKNFHLDRDTLDDAIDIYEAPRVEVEDGVVYIFTRYCYPEGKDIATEPLLIVHTAEYILTIARIETPILQRLFTNQTELITTQKTKILLQMLAEINFSYERQLRKVSKRLLQLRAQMRQAHINTKEFVGIIELEEDLNEFLSALQPQALLFRSLLGGKYLKLHEDDRDGIEDIERSTAELIGQVQGRLRTLVNMRQAYDAIATTNLNNTFKRLTSIAIFLTIPTIIGGLYGMNVDIPLQHTKHAFLFVMGLIVVFTTAAIWFFNRKKWL